MTNDRLTIADQTSDIILDRLRKSYGGDIAKIEGSFSYDALSSNAVEFQKAYAEMQLMFEAAYADTSWGKYLTMIAAQYGVIRKQAQKSKVVLTVAGNAGAQIIKNSLFETADKTKFYTIEDCTIGANGITDITAYCDTAGTLGNVKAGSVVNIPYSIPSVNSIINTKDAYDGFDEESDEQLLKRYLIKVRTPATSGNIYHYQQWALGVDGVGQAKVIPLWAGNGTVKVIIIDDNGHTASDDLIKRVSDYIESVRPIGATVTVVSPAPLAIDISATVTGAYDTTKIKQLCNDYFRQNTLSIRKISIAKIGAILIDSGIADYDYTTLKLNGANKDIVITDDILPTVGTVTLING